MTALCKGKIIVSSAAALVFLFCFNAVSSYTFQEQAPANDSVVLILNASKSVGDVIAIDVVVNVSNVSSAAFDLDFNKSVVEWAGLFTHDPRGYDRGPFFGPSSFFLIGNEFDENGTKNRGKLVIGIIGNDGVKNGSGILMTVKFKAVGNGTTNISFSNSDLFLDDLNTMENTTWLGGTLVYGGEPLQPLVQDNPPLVNLDTATRVFSSGNISLMCTASDDYGLSNLTMFTNISGTWSPYAGTLPGNRLWTWEFLVSDIPDGSYAWNCMANDSGGQAAWAESNISFAVNSTFVSSLPERSNGQPSGNLNETNVSVSLQTGANATCRYSFVPGFSYEAMLNLFSEINSTFHSLNTTLSENMTYRYFVRCNDTDGNVNNDDYLINFSIGNVSDDSQPPNVSSVTGGNVAFRSPVTLAVRTDKEADCRFTSLSPASMFSSMGLFARTDMINHSTTLTGLQEGTNYTYYVKCSDTRGNVNPSSTVISVFVCYEVDKDCSRDVSPGELNNFTRRWEADPGDISALALARALSLWKRGWA
jgi:hypothetical protein